jgi:hypothetical protein
LNSKSKHEHREGTPSSSNNPGFTWISVKSLIYHYDSMARGGPSAHVLGTPDSWVPPEVASSERLVLRYLIPMGEENHSVDTIIGKGDTIDR